MSPSWRLIPLRNSAGMVTWNFGLTVTKIMMVIYDFCWNIVIFYRDVAKLTSFMFRIADITLANSKIWGLIANL